MEMYVPSTQVDGGGLDITPEALDLYIKNKGTRIVAAPAPLEDPGRAEIVELDGDRLMFNPSGPDPLHLKGCVMDLPDVSANVELGFAFGGQPVLHGADDTALPIIGFSIPNGGPRYNVLEEMGLDITELANGMLVPRLPKSRYPSPGYEVQAQSAAWLPPHVVPVKESHLPTPEVSTYSRVYVDRNDVLEAGSPPNSARKAVVGRRMTDIPSAVHDEEISELRNKRIEAETYRRSMMRQERYQKWPSTQPLPRRPTSQRRDRGAMCGADIFKYSTLANAALQQTQDWIATIVGRSPVANGDAKGVSEAKKKSSNSKKRLEASNLVNNSQGKQRRQRAESHKGVKLSRGRSSDELHRDVVQRGVIRRGAAHPIHRGAAHPISERPIYGTHMIPQPNNLPSRDQSSRAIPSLPLESARTISYQARSGDNPYIMNPHSPRCFDRPIPEGALSPTSLSSALNANNISDFIKSQAKQHQSGKVTMQPPMHVSGPAAYDSFIPTVVSKATILHPDLKALHPYVENPVELQGNRAEFKPAISPAANHPPTAAKHEATAFNHRPTPANHRPTAANYQPTAANYQPTAANYQPTAANYQPTAANYQPTAAKYQPTAANYGLTAAKYGPTTANYGPTASNFGPPAAHDGSSTPPERKSFMESQLEREPMFDSQAPSVELEEIQEDDMVPVDAPPLPKEPICSKVFQITSNGEQRTIEAITLADSPHIVLYRDFLDREETRKIVSVIEKVEASPQNPNNLLINKALDPKVHGFLSVVMKRISALTRIDEDDFIALCPSVVKSTAMDATKDFSYVFRIYLDGRQPVNDRCNFSLESEPSAESDFPHLGISICPKLGSALIWQAKNEKGFKLARATHAEGVGRNLSRRLLTAYAK